MAALNVSRVTVTDAETLIATADQQRVLIRNIDGAVPIVIGGGDDVTFAAGFPLAAGAQLELVFSGSRGAVWGIANTGTQAVVAVAVIPIQ
jgi:hypothetical protein